MFAIATPDPDSIAETFIRQHIRLVAPGETAVVYFSGAGETLGAIPSLRVERPRSRWGGWRNTLLHGYSGALAGRNARPLLEFLQRHQVRCLLAEFGQTGCALAAVCRRAGIPLYVFFHGQDATAGARQFRSRFAYRRMAGAAAGIVVPTRFFRSKVRQVGIPEAKIHVVPYGIEVDEFQSAPQRDPHLVVAVGRMVEKKAPHLTVQAFAEAWKHVPAARLEMVGDGPLLQRARTAANTAGIADQVTFHGARPHDFVKALVSRAAVFVQHSVTAANGDTESLGVSLLEAMACEVPVVTTRHNGFVETVEDGVTGSLVEEGDVAGMAKELRRLLEDADRRAAMGKAGRLRVHEHYDASRQAARLRELMKL